MNIIMKCWTPEWYNNVTHAVIEFDVALVDDLLEKFKYAQLVAKKYGVESGFMGFEFTDYSPDFVDFGDPTEIDLEDDSLDEGYDIIPAKFQDYEFDVTSMCPVMQMVMAGNVGLKNGSVCWYGYDKHGGAGCRAETSSLFEKDIREIKEALICQSTS